jgi:hypothetical protein
MSKSDSYRQTLRTLTDWEPYLLRESGLPGPRGTLELAQAVADEGSRSLFDHLISFTPAVAPVNDPHEFLAFCGVVGLGRLLAEGNDTLLKVIRPFAADPRWRLREGVAMALQRWGKVNMPALLDSMETWSKGSWLEKRAAAAALAEPALLHDPAHARSALRILDEITASMENSPESHDPDFKVLQQGMSYCWSVVVVAAPIDGKSMLEKWLASSDPVIKRIMRENLKKNRLQRMDAAWVERMSTL